MAKARFQQKKKKEVGGGGVGKKLKQNKKKSYKTFSQSCDKIVSLMSARGSGCPNKENRITTSKS